MSTVVNTKWVKNMQFDSIIGEHKIVLDSPKESGGDDLGPSPKTLLLSSLSGCTGVDIVMILKKMRIELKSLNVKVEGELTNDMPSYYKDIKLIYEFSKDDIEYKKKIERAVKLSAEKYCGVMKQLSFSADIKQEIVFI